MFGLNLSLFSLIYFMFNRSFFIFERSFVTFVSNSKNVHNEKAISASLCAVLPFLVESSK